MSRTWASMPHGGRRTATRNTTCHTGCSWSAWPIQSPSASDQSIASMVQKEVAAQPRSSGVAEEERGKQEVAAHRNSTTRSFLVPLHQRRVRRARERRKAKGRKQVNAHQQGQYGFSTTFQKGGNCVCLEALLHQNDGNGSSCKRQHVCTGCGVARGYKQCQCLQSRLAALP